MGGTLVYLSGKTHSHAPLVDVAYMGHYPWKSGL